MGSLVIGGFLVVLAIGCGIKGVSLVIKGIKELFGGGD